jgi:hypothetical protein
MGAALVGAVIAALGLAIVAGAERLRDSALGRSERAPERLLGFYRWWSGHVVQRPTYVWSFRLVGPPGCSSDWCCSSAASGSSRGRDAEDESARAREAVRDALALMELLAGLLGALWGGGAVARTLSLQVTDPGSRGGGRPARRHAAGRADGGHHGALVCLLVAGGAYLHARRARVLGLAGLWLGAGLYYLFAVLSWGVFYAIPWLLALGAALVGTLRMPLGNAARRRS